MISVSVSLWQAQLLGRFPAQVPGIIILGIMPKWDKFSLLLMQALLHVWGYGRQFRPNTTPFLYIPQRKNGPHKMPEKYSFENAGAMVRTGIG